MEIEEKRTLFHLSIVGEQSNIVIPSELLMVEDDPKMPKLLDAKVWFLSHHIFLQALVDVVQNQGGKSIELEDYSIIADAV